jgi:hypothetical protein
MIDLPFSTRRRSRPLTRTGRVWGAVASLVLLAALSTAPAGSAARAGRTAGVPVCPAAGLVAWLDTNGNGAAGTIFFKLHFTNLSGHRCTVRGFPGVSAANASGHGIGPGASRFTGSVHTITLRNGATAAANLGIVEALNFPPALCRPTTAAGLRVFAPGATRAKFVPFPFAACTHHVSLRISPVAAH